jgi:hypothetical protein
MDDYEINDVGSVGLVQDLPAHTIVPEAFDKLENMRCFDGKLAKLRGQTTVFTAPDQIPLFIQQLVDPSQVWWLYASMDKIWVWDGSAYFDISRAAGYTATEASQWDGTVLGGIPIFNNGTDVPQFWASYSTGALFDDLTAWDVSWRAKAVKAYGPYLVAMNVTKGGTAHPHMVKWSHPADPGALPISWDETDPTKDAGEYELPDSRAGLLLNGGALRGQMFLYKENAVWRMQSIGGLLVFSFSSFIDSNGMIAPKAFAQSPDGMRHVVLMQDDLVIHDGQAVRSLLTNRVRRALFNRLDRAQASKCFLFTNSEYREVWVCYPEVGADAPNRALIWNQENDALTEASINFTCAESGYVEGTELGVWDDYPVTSWDDFDGVWNTKTARKVVVGNTTPRFLQLDTGGLRNAIKYNAIARRTNLAIMGKRRDGSPIQDYKRLKMYRRVWLKASGDPFFVRVGVQEEIDGTVRWTRKKLFSPATDQFVDVLKSGRALAIEFSSRDSGLWEVHGYKPEVVPLGFF